MTLLAQTYPNLDPRHGVLVADGYGMRIAVERGHLLIVDGHGRERRNRRLPKVGHGISRLVVLGHTGTVSLDALRWLDRVGIHFTQIDTDGTTLTASARPQVANARLRRAQVLAHDTEIGISIVRGLLDAKLAGQARNTRVHLFDADTADRIDTYRQRLADAATYTDARELEASAALDYFNTWVGNVAPRWAARDRDRVPNHWTRFAARRSQIGRGRTNSRATDPVNAILNYLYALGEAECQRACLVLGLDPGLGYLHADTPGRASLALDLLEVIRPDIDAYALQLTETHAFTAAHFTETDEGNCRLLPPLTHHLAPTVTTWSAAIAPYAERVAHALADASPYQIPKATPLTSTTRKRRADELSANRRKPGVPARNRSASLSVAPPRVCVDCGTALRRNSGDVQRCALCGNIARELGRQRGRQSIAAALADDTWRQDRNRAISATKQQRSLERAKAVGYDPDAWNSDLGPRAARLSLKAIMDATGLAISHASRIKSGRAVPDPKHWRALDLAAGPT